MRIRTLGSSFLLVAAFLPAVAQAQVVRTWVSTAGTDNPSCTRSAPCRTFGAAVDAVDTGGEVVVLDSGGYGAFVIDKGVTIVAPAGIHAAIAPTSGVAIEIAAGATDAVRLVNLHLTSKGAATGISFTSGSALTIESSSIDGFSNMNIAILAEARITLTGTSSTRAISSGLFVGYGGAAPVILTVDDCRFEGSFQGIMVYYNARALIRDSVINRHAYGIDVYGLPGALVTIENSAVAFNEYGIIVSGVGSVSAGMVRLSESVVVDNSAVGVGVYTGGIAYSRGNNTIHGNPTGPLTPLSGQ